jgi:hypothetical protein
MSQVRPPGPQLRAVRADSLEASLYNPARGVTTRNEQTLWFHHNHGVIASGARAGPGRRSRRLGHPRRGGALRFMKSDTVFNRVSSTA